MPSLAFVTSFAGNTLSAARRSPLPPVSSRRAPRQAISMADGAKQGGFFSNLRKTVLRPLVTVPGSGGKGDLLECVFCEGVGKCDCDACKGTGKDALGTCMMCDGKTTLLCTVCNGFGAVDRIRRGGTDDRNTYFAKEMKKLD